MPSLAIWQQMAQTASGAAKLLTANVKKDQSMARIAGVDLPRQKQARIALTYIYGIGNPRARRILGAANVDPFKKVQDLGEDEVNRIRQVIEEEGQVEGDLRKDVSMHIKRLIDIQSYRGLRHRRNLPTRGQRTHTNARTRKGPRKGTIAGKKKATAKT
jgi:small subunit ribosomal protein S13